MRFTVVGGNATGFGSAVSGLRPMTKRLIAAAVLIAVGIGLSLSIQVLSQHRQRSEIVAFVEAELKQHLVSPDSATFHPRTGADAISVLQDEDGQWIVAGEVSSTNAFNARLREDFLVTVERDEGELRSVLVSIGTDVVKH